MDEIENENEDSAKFAMQASHLRTIAEAMLAEHFGDRCEEFSQPCVCCKRWAALDALIDNPYEDPL